MPGLVERVSNVIVTTNEGSTFELVHGILLWRNRRLGSARGLIKRAQQVIELKVYIVSHDGLLPTYTRSGPLV